jgi:hypothetical protein
VAAAHLLSLFIRIDASYWPRGGSGQHPSMTTMSTLLLVVAVFPMFGETCP